MRVTPDLSITVVEPVADPIPHVIARLLREIADEIEDKANNYDEYLSLVEYDRRDYSGGSTDPAEIEYTLLEDVRTEDMAKISRQIATAFKLGQVDVVDVMSRALEWSKCR